jgi:hypothetical protein
MYGENDLITFIGIFRGGDEAMKNIPMGGVFGIGTDHCRWALTS